MTFSFTINSDQRVNSGWFHWCILLYRWRYSGTSARCRRENTSSQCVPPASDAVSQQATSRRAGVCVRGWRCFRARLWIVCWFFSALIFAHLWKVLLVIYETFLRHGYDNSLQRTWSCQQIEYETSAVTWEPWMW